MNDTVGEVGGLGYHNSSNGYHCGRNNGGNDLIIYDPGEPGFILRIEASSAA